MSPKSDDLGEVAGQLRGLLSEIEVQETSRTEDDDPSKQVRAATDDEILPEGVNVEEGTRIDEFCILSTDEDYIYAVLTVLPNRPKEYEIPIDGIVAELKRMGVRFGVRKANIDKAVQVARRDRHSRIDLILAQGRRPVHGVDAQVTFHWTMGADSAVVQKGDLLIEKEPGRLSKDGRNILGEVLKARKREETTIVAEEGVACWDDGLQIFAARDGIVRWDDGRVWVEPEDRDGHVTIELATDMLSATMCLYPPTGNGNALTVGQVVEQLFDSGVTFGIKKKAIVDSVKHVDQTGEAALDVLVAEGRPATHGQDGRFELLVDVRSKVDRYWIDATGEVDYYKLKRIDSVQEGDLLARLTAPSPGRSGCTVTGDKLPGAEGKPAKVRLGENVFLSPDETEIYAEITGQIHYENDEISVKPVHVVDGDIDFATGNLEFVGDLIVRGNVLDGFELQAGGNVTVEGTVGASKVYAGGNINVARGVFGKERGMIRADGDVIVTFLQNAKVFAVGDLNVGNQILNSSAYACGKVAVKTGKGIIVGGRVQAGKGIDAKIIGSDFGTRTEVVSGIDWKVEERLKRLRQQIERQQENQAKLDSMLQQFMRLAQGRLDDLPPQDRELAMAALSKRKSIEKELFDLQNQQRETRTKILVPLPADIIATNILHADVRCTIWDAMLRVRNPEKCVRISYNEDTERLDIKSYIA